MSQLFEQITTDAPKLEKQETFYLLLEQLFTEYADFNKKEVSISKLRQAGKNANTTIEINATTTTEMDANKTTERNMNTPSEIYDMLCKYMEDHFEENVTLDQLAQLAGRSKYYLLRSFTNTFKEFIGVTPKQYQRIYS